MEDLHGTRVDDLFDAELDGELDAPRLPPIERDGPRRRRPDGPPRRNLPIWTLIAAVGAIIAIERLSMITFVTSAGPGLLIASGTVFLGGNAALWFFGARYLSRKMAEARPARDATGRIIRTR